MQKFEVGAVGIVFLLLLIIGFVVDYALTVFIAWIFGITEAWAKGIIFALLLVASGNSVKTGD